MKINLLSKLFIYVICICNIFSTSFAFAEDISNNELLWVNSQTINSTTNIYNISKTKSINGKLNFLVNNEQVIQKDFSINANDKISIDTNSVLKASNINENSGIVTFSIDDANSLYKSVDFNYYSNNSKNMTVVNFLDSEILSDNSYFIYDKYLYPNVRSLKLYIYNLTSKNFEGNIKVYNKVGELYKVKEIQSIEKGNGSLIEFNKDTEGTFHIIPNGESKYIIFLVLESENNKISILKPLSSFVKSSFLNASEVLSLSNISNEYTQIGYEVYDKGVKKFNGYLSFVPYSQKFLSLDSQLSSLEMPIIKLFNYYSKDNDNVNKYFVANINLKPDSVKVVNNFSNEQKVAGIDLINEYNITSNGNYVLNIFNEDNKETQVSIINFSDDNYLKLSIKANDFIQVPLAEVVKDGSKKGLIYINSNNSNISSYIENWEKNNINTQGYVLNRKNVTSSTNIDANNDTKGKLVDNAEGFSKAQQEYLENKIKGYNKKILDDNLKNVSKELDGVKLTGKYNIELPWSKAKFPKGILSCHNFSNNDVKIGVFSGSNKDNLEYFVIPANGDLKQKIRNLNLFKDYNKNKFVNIKILNDSEYIICNINKISYKGNVAINSSDIIIGKSYIAAVPFMYNKPHDAKIYIYNLEDKELILDVNSYSNVGKLLKTKQVKISSNKSKKISFNNISTRHRSYEFIPKDNNSKYFAFYEVKDANNKNYMVKADGIFDDGAINNSNGVLVITNTVDVPSRLNFSILSNGKKRFQAQRWIMPKAQSIIDLRTYTKDLENSLILISSYSDIKPIFCSTNEKNDEVCKTKFNRGYLVVNFYPNKKASPQKVSFVDFGNFNESQFYNINDKNIQVRCFQYNKSIKDNDNDGLCNYEEKSYGTNYTKADTDGDGIKDGDELLVYFSDPLSNDGDRDGYSDLDEIKSNTKAFDPADYPGLQSDDFVTYLQHVVNSDTQYKLKYYNGSINKKGMFSSQLKSSSSQYGDFLSYVNQLIFARNSGWGSDIYKDLCKGIDICFKNPGGDYYKNIILNCLMNIQDVISDVADIDRENCNFCNISFKGVGTDQPCTNGETIDFEFRSGLGGGAVGMAWTTGLIQITPSGRREQTVCHEIAHQFGLQDVYSNPRLSGWLCSVMHASGSGCDVPSNADRIMLKIRALSERTKVSYDTLVNSLVDCDLPDKTKGIRISYNSIVSDCMPLPAAGGCKNEPQCRTNPNEKSGGYCSLCGKYGGYPRFNPKNTKDYICCPHEQDIYLNGGCCTSVGKYQDKQFCCDEEEHVALYPQNSTPTKKERDKMCKICDDLNFPYLIYNDNDASQVSCCANLDMKICNDECCDGTCYKDNNNGEHCCHPGEQFYPNLKNKKCCAKSHINSKNGVCCDGEYCNGKCCELGQSCVNNQCSFTNEACNEIGGTTYIESLLRNYSPVIKCCITSNLCFKEYKNYSYNYSNALIPIHDCCNQIQVCEENKCVEIPMNTPSSSSTSSSSSSLISSSSSSSVIAYTIPSTSTSNSTNSGFSASNSAYSYSGNSMSPRASFSGNSYSASNSVSARSNNSNSYGSLGSTRAQIR